MCISSIRQAVWASRGREPKMPKIAIFPGKYWGGLSGTICVPILFGAPERQIHIFGRETPPALFAGVQIPPLIYFSPPGPLSASTVWGITTIITISTTISTTLTTTISYFYIYPYLYLYIYLYLHLYLYLYVYVYIYSPNSACSKGSWR